mgnify:CR=1 FL=1
MTAAAPCEVWFYHLERTGLDQALPELLEKTLARGWRALVRAQDKDRIEHLDGLCRVGLDPAIWRWMPVHVRDREGTTRPIACFGCSW